MKCIKFVAMSGIIVLMSGILMAAEKPMQTKEEITRTAMRANKKALVANNMNLTPEQETIFWPMYDEYQIEINKLNADREMLVKKFAINYQSMSDELAAELMEKAIDVDKKRLDLRKLLISTFSKKFPPKVVARYFQIENKVDIALINDVQSQIPLMK
jgi:hypothetical protein